MGKVFQIFLGENGTPGVAVEYEVPEGKAVQFSLFPPVVTAIADEDFDAAVQKGAYTQGGVQVGNIKITPRGSDD